MKEKLKVNKNELKERVESLEEVIKEVADPDEYNEKVIELLKKGFKAIVLADKGIMPINNSDGNKYVIISGKKGDEPDSALALDVTDKKARLKLILALSAIDELDYASEESSEEVSEENS